jgi:nicotinamidase-related amidase
MAKAVSIVACVLLLTYFLFTSGLVFEVTASEMEGNVDMPYSLALSGERTGVLEIYTDGDVDCAKWLVGEGIRRTGAILFMHVLADAPTECWVGKPEEQIWISWWDHDIVPHVDAKILPLLDWARQSEAVVVFSSGSCDGEQWELLPELAIDEYGDPIISDCNELDMYLEERGITTIFYVGYTTNCCILDSSTGMRMMDRLGYNVVLVGDCTLPAPALPCTEEQALDEINRKYGGVIDSSELKSWFGEVLDDSLPIYADYNGVALLLGYVGDYERLVSYEPDGAHYLFLTSWNTRHHKMVIGISPASRTYRSLPDLGSATEVFRRGDAVVYCIAGN